MARRPRKAARKASRRRAPPTRPPPGKAARDRRVKRAFQGVVAVVGLLVALTQLVDWLERRGDPAPSLVAEFAALELRRNEALRDFIRATGQTPEGSRPEQRDERGVGMRMRIRAQADPPRTLVVRWTVVDAATGRRIPGARWSRIVARLQAGRELRERDVPCWIEFPDVRRFLVLLTVETEQGRVLAKKRTVVILTGRRS